jgi:hypothetical protein
MKYFDACSLCHSHYSLCSQLDVCEQYLDGNASPSLVGCVCRDGFYVSGIIAYDHPCLPCSAECTTCNDQSFCVTCKSINTFIKQGTCICQQGFWNDSQLIEVNDCKPCHKECRTCSSLLKCDSCIALNSKPDDLQGCICLDKFYSMKILDSVNSCFHAMLIVLCVTQKIYAEVV